ncbi:hypothetical protein DL95DRAFT_400424 [Leptodontidium sp. 2 PMI_412]|nr:hypothetical protein DL95DRAFT_400424 [Leptodontidium sp. 2 PMI_412]
MATSSRLSDMLLKVQDDGLDTAAALLETYNKKLQKFRAANPTMGFNVVSVLAEHETWEVYWPNQPYTYIPTIDRHNSKQSEFQISKSQSTLQQQLLKQGRDSGRSEGEWCVMEAILESSEDQLARAEGTLKAQLKRRDAAIQMRVGIDRVNEGAPTAKKSKCKTEEQVSEIQHKQIEVGKLLQLIKVEKLVLKKGVSKDIENARELDSPNKEINAGSKASCVEGGKGRPRVWDMVQSG